MKDIIIIGGGVTGLTTGYLLKHQYGKDVLILEKETRVGGKAKTEYHHGFTTEMGTNGWLDKEPAIRSLIDDLGINNMVQPSNDAASRRFIYRNGKLRELHMHPIKFLAGSALPFSARLRIAIEPFISPSDSDEDETLADFATRRLGPKATELLIGPMASGVYAGDPKKMSIKSCFSKVQALEAQYGGLIKGMIALKKQKKKAGEDPKTVQAGPSGKLTSMKGGVQNLVDALASKLNGCIQVDTQATKIKNTKNGFEVYTNKQTLLKSKTILSASPAWAAADYLASLDENTARAFSQIPYPGLDVVCLGFPKEKIHTSLNRFGFLVPRGQGIKMLGSLFTSTIFEGRSPSDHILLRNMIGGMLEPEISSMEETKVIQIVREDLEKSLGIPVELNPSFQKVYRHEKSIPQYHVGHEKLKKRIFEAENRVPGFFASGNAIKGIGMIDCVREAYSTAESINKFLLEKYP